MVKHKTFAIVVIAADFLEILEDAAVELEDVLVTFVFHERPRLFAADTAGAEHHHWLLFEFVRQLADGVGKFAKGVDVGDDGSLECAEFDLVVVAGIQQGDRPPFVQPAL